MTMHVGVETLKSDVDYCLVQMPVCAMEPYAEDIPATFEIDRENGVVLLLSVALGGLTLTEEQFAAWAGADQVKALKDQCFDRWIEQTDEGRDYALQEWRELAAL